MVRTERYMIEETDFKSLGVWRVTEILTDHEKQPETEQGELDIGSMNGIFVHVIRCSFPGAQDTALVQDGCSVSTS